MLAELEEGPCEGPHQMYGARVSHGLYNTTKCTVTIECTMITIVNFLAFLIPTTLQGTPSISSVTPFFRSFDDRLPALTTTAARRERPGCTCSSGRWGRHHQVLQRAAEPSNTTQLELLQVIALDARAVLALQVVAGRRNTGSWPENCNRQVGEGNQNARMIDDLRGRAS